MTGRLDGRVALVTGGGGEIGGAISRVFAAEGAKVAIADLEPAKAEAVANAIVASGGSAHGLKVDVSDEASAREAVANTIKTFGRLTTLVNVAATITPDGTVETLTLAQWNEALAVNLTGSFVMCKFGVPELRRAGGGSIINIASQLGHMGVPLRSPYCTTKAALIHFTRILAMDHAVDNIRANTISPGFISDRTLQRPHRRQGEGANDQRAAASAQPPGRAGGNRSRCALSRLRRVRVRHRDRSPDRRRLRRLQGQDRARGPAGVFLSTLSCSTHRAGRSGARSG